LREGSLGEEIPDSYVSYFSRFLDSLTSRFTGSLYRYITPSESVYWVAYEGFHLGKTYVGKVSMTLSPVLNTWSLTGWKLRGAWMELTGDFHQWARAVPYTHDIDPRTRDPLYVYEFELAVYAEDYKRKVEMDYPWVSEERLSNYMVLPMRDVQTVRLIPEVLDDSGVNEKDYYKLKVLPGYVHGTVRHRSPYKMLPRGMLVQQIAIVTVSRRDFKLRAASNYAWDSYWQRKDMLAYPPNYEKALDIYGRLDFVTTYRTDDIEAACLSSFIPMDVCWELIDEIVDEIKGIYSMFNVSVEYVDRRGRRTPYTTPAVVVSSEARMLFRSFPDMFKTPEEAEHFLKWWHAGYDEAFKYLADFLFNERVYRRVRLRDDPEVMEG
jgi:hypothetical protein